MANKVLDSFAIIAFLEDEPGADKVRELLLKAEGDNMKLFMTVVNLGEVWYSIARATSMQIADQSIQELEGLDIEFVDADWSLTHQAAIYKAKGNISFADCFAAALAKLRKAELVTGDHEFKILEDEIKILWL